VTLATIAGFKSANMSFPFVYGTNAPTTSTIVKRFKDTGRFIHLTDKKYLKSSDYLRAGDILVRKGHHTVMVLENGPKWNQ
jgi:hypothetical protein